MTDLPELSAAATQGALVHHGWGDGSTLNGVTNIFNEDAEVLLMECIPEADAAFIVALWNAYRTGQLVERAGMIGSGLNRREQALSDLAAMDGEELALDAVMSEKVHRFSDFKDRAAVCDGADGPCAAFRGKAFGDGINGKGDICHFRWRAYYWQAQAAVVTALQAENERLREALGNARTDLLEVGNDYPGSSCQKWCTERAAAAWNILKPWEHCPSTHCERAQECRSINDCAAEKRTLNRVNSGVLADLIADTADHPEPNASALTALGGDDAN